MDTHGIPGLRAVLTVVTIISKAEIFIILLHETVPFRKNGKDITIELYAQQYNHHAEEIGEEKACQLSDTDVLAEKFPNKSVHISHIYN